jgi:MFS family permease
MNASKSRNTTLLIIVSALGYFVDVYDLLLFSVVRTKSLLDIGVPQEEVLSTGLSLLNYQTVGLLVGGILWGVLGDKRGRLTVLFGSILIYSLANLGNAFVTSVEQYKILRLIAGIGLAGELGAGVTIVMETMKKDRRTIGITIIASFGLLGAIVAGYVGQVLDWRTSYIIGGLLGFVLLFLRIGAKESGIYSTLKTKNVKRGNFLRLIKERHLFLKYIKTIGVGLPTYFVVGLLLTIVPEFSEELGIKEPVSTGTAMMYCFTAFTLADVIGGLLSQLLKSRKKVFYFFNFLTLAAIIIFFLLPASTADGMYWRLALLGFSIGYWALIVTNSSEQFGTNLRATVTTTVPNFVRGMLAPMAFIFQLLTEYNSITTSGLIVGLGAVILALLATRFTTETFHRDLDFED